MTTFTISFPLDSEGFLRRECPSCEVECKIQVIDKNSQSEIHLEELNAIICPYCNCQESSEKWFTQLQVEYASSIKKKMAFDIISNSMKGLGSKYLKNKSKNNVPQPTPMPQETDDMKRISVSCCARDFKVLDTHKDSVFCVSCGKSYPTD